MEDKTNLPEDKSVKLENQETNLGLYPELTQESLSMYLKDLQNIAHIIMKGFDKDIESISDSNHKQFILFMDTLQNIALSNKDYNHFLQNWKLSLVIYNRTMALTSAFTMGVAIGTFLNAPHLALDFSKPSDDIEEERGE
jgi:hypothetical protein